MYYIFLYTKPTALFLKNNFAMAVFYRENLYSKLFHH